MLSKSIQTESAGRLFDLSRKEHAKELKSWCRLHFQYTLCKGIQGANTPIYHDCCISFSKRGCVKRLSHPALQSVSVLKISTLKNASSADDLYNWIRSRMLIHYNLGQKIYFPTINTAHFSSQDDDTGADQVEPAELLGKRTQELTAELQKTEQEMTKLREENSRLLLSSRTWHDRYQELMTRIEEDKPSYTEITPKKYFSSKETITNESFLDL